MDRMNTIPIVDLKDYLHKDTKGKFIKAVGESLRDVGFFALTNHGIPDDLIRLSYTVSEEFFNLSEDIKRSYEVPGINGQRGYTSFGREHAKDHDAPDLKEFWHVGQNFDQGHLLYEEYPRNIWPSEVPQFEPTTTDIFQRLEKCAYQILEACALFIHEPSNLIADMMKDGNSILRLIHYPPVPQDCNPASVRAAAHEDINLITLLVDATSSGLEILDRNMQWIPVVTPPGCIIVDSGDMLQNLTNGYFKATTHRVTNPSDSRERRFSMPFFAHARGEVRLDPLSTCISKTGGAISFPQITAGEYLHKRLQEIGLK